jgi:hypothetical protein
LNRISRTELALRTLTALFVVVALFALVWQPAIPDAVIPPPGRHALGEGPPTSRGDAAAVSAIVTANIFAASRTAPARRYDPATLDAQNDSPPAPDPIATDVMMHGDARVPQLFGIVAGPNGASALLRLDASSDDATLYRVGDRDGGYRVDEINEQSVVLTGPAGRIVLRLNKAEGS